MEKVPAETPDLLARMLRNRTMRNLIAIALFVRVMDVYYDAAQAFVRGFRNGFEGKGFLSSVSSDSAK